MSDHFRRSRACSLLLAVMLGLMPVMALLVWLTPQPAAASHQIVDTHTPVTQPQAGGPAPIVILPSAFGVTPPLKELAKGDTAPAPDNKERPRVIPRLRPQRDNADQPLPAAPQRDEVLQAFGGNVNMPSPIADFDGLNNLDSVYPPDTNGDIGYDPSTGKKYYFQWVNLHYEAWDVTNPASPVVVVAATPGNTLWAAALPGSRCALTNDGDPIALFDEQAHRWMISQFSVSGVFHQCIAVSQTANPAGAWYVYDYQYRDGVTYFNDYPKLGVWPDPTYNAYFMSVNQFNAAGTAALGSAGAAFERAKLLVGDPSPKLIVIDLNVVNPRFDNMLPADLDGTPPAAGTPGFFFAVDDNVYKPTLGADALRIWEFRPDWTTPASSTFGVAGQPNYTLTVAAFTMLPCVIAQSSNCIPQGGAAQKLDSLGDRLMYRAAFRHFGSSQSLVVNHSVLADGVDRAGVRWYELQRDPGTGGWTINQEATYAPADDFYRWMGSLAMDRQGDMALGYSASMSTTFAQIRYAGRLLTDTLSTLPQAEVTMTVGTGAQTGSAGRWGDYAMMGVDPQDGCTFWFTTEYVQTSGSVNWRTRIGSFKFPECAPLDTGSITGSVINASNSNPISGSLVTALDASGIGLFAALTNASGQYQLMGIPTGTYTVTASATGYLPGTATGVSVSAGVTTTQNFALTPLPQSNLGISKSASPAPVYAASTLTYTLSISNAGPDPASSTVTVVDNLPSGVALGGISAPGWSCASAGGTITCTLPSLAVGYAPDILFTVTTPITPGTLTNSASVSTTGTVDLNLANNSASISTTVQGKAELSISLSGASVVSTSAILTYTITVTNNGPSPVGALPASFANASNIVISDNVAATPYPSTLNVSGLGAVVKATASLFNFNHTFPEDLDVLLVGPSGQKTFLMSDPTRGENAVALNLTFDDAAASSIACSDVLLTSGTYKPTDCPGFFGNDGLPVPAPVGPYTATLSLFTGTNPNGAWSLYVRDDVGGDSGNIAGGWGLNLTTDLGALVVTDTLPLGTTFVGAAGTGWTCNPLGGVVTCSAPNFSIGVAPSIIVTVTTPATPQTITNTVQVGSAYFDPNVSNNTAFVSTLVQEQPISGLAASNSSPTPFGSATAFSATVSAGNNITYLWNFGDGATGSGVNTTHLYASAGNYTATVTATNSTNTLTATTFVTITKVNQTINFAPLSDKVFGDPPFTITATASSGLPVTFTTTSTACAVTPSGTVTLSAAGSCTITAQQAGDANYNAAADVSQTFTIYQSRLFLPLIMKQ